MNYIADIAEASSNIFPQFVKYLFLLFLSHRIIKYLNLQKRREFILQTGMMMSKYLQLFHLVYMAIAIHFMPLLIQRRVSFVSDHVAFFYLPTDLSTVSM